MKKKIYITPQCDEILMEDGFQLLAGSVQTPIVETPAEVDAFARELSTTIEELEL